MAFLLSKKKKDLIELAEELGLIVEAGLTKPKLKDLIVKSPDYVEEDVKVMFDQHSYRKDQSHYAWIVQKRPNVRKLRRTLQTPYSFQICSQSLEKELRPENNHGEQDCWKLSLTAAVQFRSFKKIVLSNSETIGDPGTKREKDNPFMFEQPQMEAFESLSVD
ncbi:hypothetical protein TNIN_457691 [Trichonephila inaurata madagascariensis]|uniref:Uncharacterized protein n=1 Tax=Trichonephila inaurata madagascariensis TaxID=2747483 RepID=A0A8X6X1W0_9ARAC|nr:hypothetical protein TNIN_457691 [Trichonephila inaurata madagascariensis]